MKRESGNGSGMKECVVQLCMYDRDKREIFGAGSGTLISDLGHILTAAHVVMNPHNKELFHGRSNCTVLVAKYVADEKPPAVTWHAQICSTDNALKQLVTRSSDPSKKDLKDLAVLKLNGNVTCSQPPMVPGVQPVGFIAHEDNDIITGLHYLPFNTTAAPKEWRRRARIRLSGGCWHAWFHAACMCRLNCHRTCRRLHQGCYHGYRR